jgi:hypothetical protein
MHLKDGREVPDFFGPHIHRALFIEPEENASSHNVGESLKIKKAMHEYATGTLHSGSKKGPVVKNRKQAIAIALSEQRKYNRGGYR